jgi:protein arginine N-methyltransferase 2
MRVVRPRRPVAKWKELPVERFRAELRIGGHQVMMRWETPLVRHMVTQLTRRTRGTILEVGFGMGISATAIQEAGVKKHLIVEPHPEILEYARRWAQPHKARVKLIPGFWQDVLDELPPVDGILYDTYTIGEEEATRRRFEFIELASARLLRDGGALTFFHLDSTIDLELQDLIFRRYREVELTKLRVSPPKNCVYDRDVRAKGYTLSVLLIK